MVRKFLTKIFKIKTLESFRTKCVLTPKILALKLTLKFIEEYDVESNEFLEQILFNPEETEFYIKHFLFMTMPLQHSENLENQNTFKGIWDKLNNKIKLV